MESKTSHSGELPALPFWFPALHVFFIESLMLDFCMVHLCRFASTTWWWLMLSLIQIVWRWFVHDRYFGQPLAGRFIDLCTLAKVSVVLLPEQIGRAHV